MPQPTRHRDLVQVGSTGNSPERQKTVPITLPAASRRSWNVAMSLGAGDNLDLPIPSLIPGDKLRVFVELEVTTDAADAENPGLMGTPYSYSPRVDARFLLAADSGQTSVDAGQAIALAKPFAEVCSHQRHHLVVTLNGAEYEISERGLPWTGGSHINVALSAVSTAAQPKNVLLIGENEDRKDVDQDTAGIRVVRLRPGRQTELRASRDTRLIARAVPVRKQPTVIFSAPVKDLKKGEQLVVHGRLLTDARDVGYHARISTRMFLANSQTEIEPKGRSQAISTWKGHLSKENGFNCLNGEGPKPSDKFGVLRINENEKGPLYVNVVATSSAPFRTNRTPGDPLPIKSGSFVDVVRYPPERLG